MAVPLGYSCITGHYPTPHGQQLYDIALTNYESSGGEAAGRTYEAASGAV